LFGINWFVWICLFVNTSRKKGRWEKKKKVLKSIAYIIKQFFHSLALLFAQLLAQAKIVNYVVDKNSTDRMKFRFTELKKNINF
jgi:hypothetical protein